MLSSLVLHGHGQDLTSPYRTCSRRDGVTRAVFAHNVSGAHVTSLCVQGSRKTVQQMSANVDNMICSIDCLRKVVKLKRLLAVISHMAGTCITGMKIVEPNGTVTHATHSGCCE